jgi:hypothetical protein
MTSLSSHFARQKSSSAWRATWVCAFRLRKGLEISGTAMPGVVRREVWAASTLPLLKPTPDDELRVPNFIVSVLGKPPEGSRPFGRTGISWTSAGSSGTGLWEIAHVNTEVGRNGVLEGYSGGRRHVNSTETPISFDVRRNPLLRPDRLGPGTLGLKRSALDHMAFRYRSSIHHFGPARLPSGVHNLVPHLGDLPVLAADRVAVRCRRSCVRTNGRGVRRRSRGPRRRPAGGSRGCVAGRGARLIRAARTRAASKNISHSHDPVLNRL